MDMEHPVFDPIDYSDEQWEGQVKMPFFAAYNHPPSYFSPRLPGWKQGMLHEGVFDLVIQDEAGMGPTQEQERAFAHFQENQDAICAAVVAAISAYYQEQYKNRELLTYGLSKAAIEALFPALEEVEGLTRLIRFATLYVLEGMGQWDQGGTKPETWAKLNYWALLGFAFSCTWDVEHGLGVLYHRDKVVQVGSSDITWDGPADF
jgi:hypothetical protein